MPWLKENPLPCKHLERPPLTLSCKNRIWECPSCGGRWKAIYQDMGHDVMPGERSYQMFWRETKKPKVGIQYER